MTYPFYRKSSVIAFCSTTAFLFAAVVYANQDRAEPQNTIEIAQAQNVEIHDTFLQGYDVVSYFSETGPERGHKAHYLEYEGKLLSFSSPENLRQFSQSPEAYMPQYDGNCALAMAFGKHVKSSPTAWKVVKGKLYMLSNSGAVAKWQKKTDKFIAKADAKWSKISAG